MLSTILGKSNIKLIDILSLVYDSQVRIMNDLHMFDLLDQLNYRKHDTKKVFYYHILKSVCDCIISSSDNNQHVFFYNRSCIDNYRFEVLNYSNSEEFQKFLNILIKKMNSILPTLFYMCNDRCFDEMVKDVNSGEWQDVYLAISAELAIKRNRKFTFEQSKKFVDKFELTYLDREYFNKLKISALLYK